MALRRQEVLDSIYDELSSIGEMLYLFNESIPLYTCGGAMPLFFYCNGFVSKTSENTGFVIANGETRTESKRYQEEIGNAVIFGKVKKPVEEVFENIPEIMKKNYEMESIPSGHAIQYNNGPLTRRFIVNVHPIWHYNVFTSMDRPIPKKFLSDKKSEDDILYRESVVPYLVKEASEYLKIRK